VTMAFDKQRSRTFRFGSIVIIREKQSHHLHILFQGWRSDGRDDADAVGAGQTIAAAAAAYAERRRARLTSMAAAISQSRPRPSLSRIPDVGGADWSLGRTRRAADPDRRHRPCCPALVTGDA
jgi:hypothetical protein